MSEPQSLSQDEATAFAARVLITFIYFAVLFERELDTTSPACLGHTHAHTHSLTHTHTRVTLSNALSLTHTFSLFSLSSFKKSFFETLYGTWSLSPFLSLSQEQPQTRTHAHTHTHTNTHVRARTLKYTLSHTHTHTYTHTHKGGCWHSRCNICCIIC